MNQDLFNLITFCVAKRNKYQDNQELYQLYNRACLNALRYALILKDIKFSPLVNLGLLTHTTKPIIEITNSQFTQLFKKLAEEEPTSLLNNYFNTNFNYDNNYSISKAELSARSFELENSVSKRLELAARLDTLALRIDNCTDTRLQMASKDLYGYGLQAYQFQEDQFQKLDLGHILSSLTVSTQILVDNKVGLRHKIVAATAVIGGMLLIASSITLLVLSLGNPLMIGLGVAGLTVSAAILGAGIYKANSIIEAMQLFESKPNQLDLLEDAPTFQPIV